MALWTKRNNSGRLRRKARVRRKLHGSAERPRLTVFRSARHIYAQVVDDDRGITIASASTLDKSSVEGNKTEAATHVGSLIAERCKAAGVSKVVFDRNGFKYHGRVRAIADAARDNGLAL